MPDVAEVGKETQKNVEKTSGCLSQGAKDAHAISIHIE